MRHAVVTAVLLALLLVTAAALYSRGFEEGYAQAVLDLTDEDEGVSL